jgi:hypothetical protein
MYTYTLIILSLDSNLLRYRIRITTTVWIQLSYRVTMSLKTAPLSTLQFISTLLKINLFSDRLVVHTTYEGGESDLSLDMFVLDWNSPEGATCHFFRVKVDSIQFTTILLERCPRSSHWNASKRLSVVGTST